MGLMVTMLGWRVGVDSIYRKKKKLGNSIVDAYVQLNDVSDEEILKQLLALD